jgi:hypothetical protein
MNPVVEVMVGICLVGGVHPNAVSFGELLHRAS